MNKRGRKSQRGKGKSSKDRKAPVSKSNRAGLEFPVSRVAKFLRDRSYFNRISNGASIYITAALEFIMSEVLDLTGEATKALGKKRIFPQSIFMGIQDDDDLNSLFQNAIIAKGGSMDIVNEFTEKMKKKKRKRTQSQNKSQMDDSQAV